MTEDAPMSRLSGWLRFYWFQIVVAVALAAKGWATTDVVFAVLPAAPLWPWTLWTVAGAVIGSTLVPFRHRVQAATGALLFAVSALRISTYLVALANGLPERAHALAWYLITLWMVTAAVGLAWTRLTEQSALEEAVAAGRCEDG
jgi:hypothetical protein